MIDIVENRNQQLVLVNILILFSIVKVINRISGIGIWYLMFRREIACWGLEIDKLSIRIIV